MPKGLGWWGPESEATDDEHDPARTLSRARVRPRPLARGEEHPAARVRSREAAFAKTMADRDHAAFATFVSEEAVFAGRTVLRGRHAVAEGWKAYFEGPKAPFSWAPERVEVVDSGTLGPQHRPRLRPRGQAHRHLQLHLAPREGRRVAGRPRQRVPSLPLPVKEPLMPVHVRVCRDCGEEYRPVIVRCADCGGELEDRFEGESEGGAPAAAGREEPAAELVGYRVLFLTPRAADLVPMAERLRETGIEYRLAEAARTGGGAPARYALLVKDADAAGALAALARPGRPPRRQRRESTPSKTRVRRGARLPGMPACGTKTAPGTAECPECGLVLAGGEGEVEEPREWTAAALAARAKGLARDEGFDLAGVARADAPPDLAFFGRVGGPRPPPGRWRT